MNKFLILSAAGLLALFAGCQKQQSEAERNAEIERQVNERLAAERQAQEQQHLAQRQDELDARLGELNEQQRAPASTPEPQRTERSTRETFAPEPAASYSMFYTGLEPFGVWRDTPVYGYVWQPRQAMDSRSWRPYTNGHWVYTDAGWTWISEEPFGWATYHYGRWMRLRGIGWVWVPDTEWAPAWVSWRSSNDYVGWAPLPPEARFERHTGIHTWADNYYDIGPEQYCFVPTREIGAERIERVVVPSEQNVTIVNQTTNVTNITYNNTIVVNQGPNYDELRARSQQPIARLRLERRTALETENLRAIVKGEVVEMPAAVIAPARPVERPPTVKETVTETVVERGWEGIADQQAAQQARAKIKSEATPPPNVPPKTFVKPAPVTAQTRSTAPSPEATAIARSTITPAATSPVQTPTPARAARPVQTPMPSRPALPRITPAERPAPMATPLVTRTPTMSTRAATSPARPTATPIATPTATLRPTVTPVSTPAAIARPTFSPRVLPPQFSPRPSATAVFSSTPAAAPTFGRAETKEQRETQKESRKQERAARKEERFERATPTAAAIATASIPASSSAGTVEPRGKHKKHPGEAATSPTATPTATPTASPSR
jgi:hypothetical protein